MSEENVEAVREIYERFSEGDFRASVDLFDRHVLYLMMPDAPEAEDYVGVEAVATGRGACLRPGQISQWTRRS